MVFSIRKKNKTPVVPRPPYSPDHSPAEFFLFPKLKVSVKLCNFNQKEKMLQLMTQIFSKPYTEY